MNPFNEEIRRAAKRGAFEPPPPPRDHTSGHLAMNDALRAAGLPPSRRESERDVEGADPSAAVEPPADISPTGSFDGGARGSAVEPEISFSDQMRWELNRRRRVQEEDRYNPDPIAAHQRGRGRRARSF